jgi:hypothetical protein
MTENTETELREWVIWREVEWDEPTPTRPNGRYRARVVATEADVRAIEKAVGDALERGEGLLSHVRVVETKILLSWRPATHPKKARRWLQGEYAAGRRARPTVCDACGQTEGEISAHSESYAEPFGRPHRAARLVLALSLGDPHAVQ